MKKIVRMLSWASCLGLAIVWMGCAGTRYEQSTGEMIDSATITTKVKAALLDDPEVKGLDVDVDTFKNVVKLNGTVDSDLQRKKAEDITWGIEGVRSVENNLMIRGMGSANQVETRSGSTRGVDIDADANVNLDDGKAEVDVDVDSDRRSEPLP